MTYKLFKGNQFAIFRFILTDMDMKPLRWEYNSNLKHPDKNIQKDLKYSLKGSPSGLYTTEDFYSVSIVSLENVFVELL